MLFAIPGDKPKLSDALRTLLPLADDWTTIGTLLEVEQHVLSRIDREERKSNDCLRQMLSEWFKQIDNPTTWNTLAEAVEAINPAEAKNIRDMFAY